MRSGSVVLLVSCVAVHGACLSSGGWTGDDGKPQPGPQSDGRDGREESEQPAELDAGQLAAQLEDAGLDFDPAEIAHMPLFRLPDMLARATCAALDTCLGATALAELIGAEDCVEHSAAELRAGEFAHIEAGIVAGRVLYDPRELAVCLAAIAGLGCEVSPHDFPDACVSVLLGNVAPGGACTINAECEGDGYCAGRDACPSTCQPRLLQGKLCRGDEECGRGLVCEAERCTHPSGAGEPCGGDLPGACALGLVCVGETSGKAGECVSRSEVFVLEEAESCSPIAELCVEGLYCVRHAANAYRCEARVQQDEECRAGVNEQCSEGQYCDVSEAEIVGRCRDLPGSGEPCAPHQACAAGDACVAMNGAERCQTIGDNGAPCSHGGACRSHLCVEGVCVAPMTCE